ncbi:MAG: glutamate racemase [Myxococcota bacterium]|nr:glutamate racemase [Myxococcota bacterium]
MPQSPENQPIGVFDSGIGGLTVLAAIEELLPNESLLYLGDTARVPYGTRSPETIRRYAERVASHLWKQGMKALVIACNTASTYALEPLAAAGAELGIPVLGVIEPGVKEALAQSKTGRIAILGTEGTVRGGRYQALLSEGGAEVEALPCPLFVALAEEGWTHGPIAEAVAKRYLSELKSDPDTVILGCTHYPLLAQTIQSVLPNVTLIDSAKATARSLEEALEIRKLLNQRASAQKRFLVTDNVERFTSTGTAFLKKAPHPVELIDLSVADGPFAETDS